MVLERPVGKEVLFMLQDPISDCLTRIRNAYARKKVSTLVHVSKQNQSILTVLKEQGSIQDFTQVEEGRHPMIEVVLAYSNNRPSLLKVDRKSRPGLRVYMAYRDLPVFKSNLAYGIISTPKGMMTTQQAKIEKLGGEIICVVE